MTHKLERTEVQTRSRIRVRDQKPVVSRQEVSDEITEKDYSREDESGYLADSDRELEMD